MDIEIYKELIIEHGTNPRNFNKETEGFNYNAKGINPLCGDKITLFLKIEDNIIKDVTFTGGGCAISMASASLMSESLINISLDDAKELFDKFHKSLTSEEIVELSNKLSAFSGVKQYPSRVKCATLAWHTLINALNNNNKTTCTE